MISRPLLSAIMIVKNEEENLPRCLSSLKGWCEDICVTDTGSEDRTREIAEEYGARVSFFAWNGNESDARNASAREARGRWLLIIDADEEISPELAQEIGQKLPQWEKDTQVGAVCVQLRNHYLDGSSSVNSAVRLIRNHEDFRFEGTIHPKAIFHGSTAEARGHLEHYGYMWTPEQRRTKGKRMIEALAPYVVEVEHPELGRLSQYLTYLLVAEQTEEFWKRLEQSLAYPAEERLGNGYWRQAAANAFKFFGDRDDTGKLLPLAEELARSEKFHPGAHFLLLRSAVKVRSWNRARKEASAILQNPGGQDDTTFPEEQLPAARAWRWLAAPEDQPPPPDLFQNSRLLPALLYAKAHAMPLGNASSPELASLLKFTPLLLGQPFPPTSLPGIEASLKRTLSSAEAPSPAHLLANLLLIELSNQSGNLNSVPAMLQTLLNEYPSHRWLAMAARQATPGKHPLPGLLHEELLHLL